MGSKDIWAFNVTADVMPCDPLLVQTAAVEPIEGLSQPSPNDELRWLVWFRPVLAQYEHALRQDGWEPFDSLKLMQPDDMKQCGMKVGHRVILVAALKEWQCFQNHSALLLHLQGLGCGFWRVGKRW